MTTKTLALVKDGIVVDRVLVPSTWPFGEQGVWQAPEDMTIVASETAFIGDRYVDGHFLRKVVWNDASGNPIPDFEIDVDNPPAEVIPA